ncbi:hypothetical protein C8R46DRAFT_1095488, partial [Mycena filopes]
MLVSHPPSMSKPFFKRQKTLSRPDEYPSRSASPAASFYGEGLHPHELPPRGASPAGSFYSQLSSSSPSVNSASSSGSASRTEGPPLLPALALGSSWLMRSPRPTPTLDVVSLSPPAPDFASPPETPVEVPEAELRRRQLEKATRILGESVPLELVFQPPPPPVPLVNAFPDPPPRQSTEGPEPGQPREMLTERRTGKLARRASLSLSNFAAKFRSAPQSAAHSRDSSQGSSSSSDHSQRHISPSSPGASFIRIIPRRRSLILASPILFAFPDRERSPSRAQTAPTTPDGPVIDIRSPEPGFEEEEELEGETPVREHPAAARAAHTHSASEALPRIVPMPLPHATHTHAKSESEWGRPETPYARPETPFGDYYPARPATPFEDFADEDDPGDNHNGYLRPEAGVSRRERGQGWSGEWNQRDMRDVMRKLRSL